MNPKNKNFNYLYSDMVAKATRVKGVPLSKTQAEMLFMNCIRVFMDMDPIPGTMTWRTPGRNKKRKEATFSSQTI